MTARLFAIALRMWAVLHIATPDARDIASAIALEAHDDYEAALVATYAAYESGVRMRPNAYSHDALAHESCGVLQLPCEWVEAHPTARQQVRRWLQIARLPGGVVSLDSSPSRAYRRFATAMLLLAQVR